MHFVYTIQSKKTKDLYYGRTTNLSERLNAHNAGRNTSTRKGVPWIYVYIECYRSKKDAIVREKQLKQYGNARTYVKRRIQNSLLE